MAPIIIIIIKSRMIEDLELKINKDFPVPNLLRNKRDICNSWSCDLLIGQFESSF